MQLQNNDYSREKKYALSRFLFIIILTITSFIFLEILNQPLNSNFFFLKVLSASLTLFSLLFYIFVMKFPDALVSVRKGILIIVDLTVLTLAIIFADNAGLFLLPLYIILVMESGVSFGLRYFYLSLILSSLSWMMLLLYSDYWQGHVETIAVFAITTFFIPLLYLKQMMRMNQKHDKLNQTLVSTSHDANYDMLTGLPNRKQYDTFMKALLKEKDFFALLFIDLNKFKMINDTHGHEIGDEVLVEVSKRLTKSIDEEDLLARLGGDEFVIITTRKQVFLAKFLEKLEQITIGEHRVEDVTVLIELSIGVSVYPEDSKSEIFLRKYADEAMYAAKSKKDTYHVMYSELET